MPDMDKIKSLLKSANKEIREEKQPLPQGAYEAKPIKGEVFESSRGTPGYKITYQVVSGDYSGRYVWQTVWFTEHAARIAAETFSQLRVCEDTLTLTDDIVCQVEVILRTANDGSTFNEAKKPKFLRQEVEEEVPYAYTPTTPKQDKEEEEESRVLTIEEFECIVRGEKEGDGSGM